jgi:hypothetical protein
MIIGILQKELLTSTTKNACVNESVAIQGSREQDNAKKWTLVSSKNHTVKPKGKTAKLNQPVKTSNRYSPLSEVLTSNEGTCAVSTNEGKKRNKRSSHKNTTSKGVNGTQTEKKQVIVMGDSHARGCAAELLAVLRLWVQ